MKGLLFRNWKIQAIAANPDKEWQTRRGIKELNIESDVWELIPWQYPPTAKFARDAVLFRHKTTGDEVMVRPRYRSGETVK